MSYRGRQQQVQNWYYQQRRYSPYPSQPYENRYYEAMGQTSQFESKTPSKGRDNYNDRYRNRDSGSSHRDDNKYDHRTDSRDSESRSKSSTSSLNHKKESGRVESSQRVDVHRPDSGRVENSQRLDVHRSDRSIHRPTSHRSERSQASDTYRSEGPRVEVYRSESHRQDSSRSNPHRSDVSRSETRQSAQRPDTPRIDVEWAESHRHSELPRQVVDSNHTVDSGAPQQALTEHETQHQAEVRRTALRICDEWSEHLSSLGQPFFYSHLTGVSKWEKPKEWDDLKMVVTEIGRNHDRADQLKPAVEQPKNEGRNELRHDGRGDGRRDARPDQRSEQRPDTWGDSRTDQVGHTSPSHHRRHSDHRHLQDNHRHRQDDRHRPRQAAPLNGCMPPTRQVELIMSVNRTPLSSPELHLPENGVLRHSMPSPTPSQSSSQRGSVKGLVPAQAIRRQTTYALPPSLGNYYCPELTSHVQEWPSQQMERQADSLFRDGLNQSSYFNRVTCELKNARSYVRMVEMQTKRQERKYLNLHSLIKQVVALPDGQILPDRNQH